MKKQPYPWMMPFARLHMPRTEARYSWFDGPWLTKSEFHGAELQPSRIVTRHMNHGLLNSVDVVGAAGQEAVLMQLSYDRLRRVNVIAIDNREGNASSERRYSYSKNRDLLLESIVVRRDGIISSSEKVVHTSRGKSHRADTFVNGLLSERALFEQGNLVRFEQYHSSGAILDLDLFQYDSLNRVTRFERRFFDSDDKGVNRNSFSSTTTMTTFLDRTSRPITINTMDGLGKGEIITKTRSNIQEFDPMHGFRSKQTIDTIFALPNDDVAQKITQKTTLLYDYDEMNRLVRITETQFFPADNSTKTRLTERSYSSDGLTSKETIDENGDGTMDSEFTTVENAQHTRLESIQSRPLGTVLSMTVTTLNEKQQILTESEFRGPDLRVPVKVLKMSY